MLPVGFASVATSAYLSEFPIPSPPLTSLKHLPASNLNRGLNTSEEKYAALDGCLSRTIRCCPCGRRHFLGASAAAAVLSPLFYVQTGNSLALDANGSTDKFRPARPDWYEELFAKAMEEGMRSYEAEVAGYKADLFSSFTGTCKDVLELGVGTGPNFKYYAHVDDLNVVGVDPNKQMEKYAQGAALAAGLLPMSFTFMQGVGEDLPVEDGTMDAVVGTLVLCTVNDVNLTLKEVKRVLKAGGLYLFIEHVAARDGSLLRFTQSILDPLQQFVADGCHLTRETGELISHAGFSNVNINMISVPTISIISPHVYGIACK